MAHRRERAETDGPGAEHDDTLAGHHLAGQRGVDRARRRFDHHRGLVGHPGGDEVELGVVGDEFVGPPSAGVRAVAGLQARTDVTKRDPLAGSRAARGARRAERLDPTDDAGEHRLDDDALAGVPAIRDDADDLVTGHERERDDVLEEAASSPRRASRDPIRRSRTGAARPGASSDREGSAGRFRRAVAGRPRCPSPIPRRARRAGRRRSGGRAVRKGGPSSGLPLLVGRVRRSSARGARRRAGDRSGAWRWRGGPTGRRGPAPTPRSASRAGGRSRRASVPGSRRRGGRLRRASAGRSSSRRRRRSVRGRARGRRPTRRA